METIPELKRHSIYNPIRNLNPNQPLAVYARHAVESGQWVSIQTGIPLFYAAARWIARTRPTAMTMCLIVLAVDAVILALAAGTTALPVLWLIALSYVSKLAAAWFGGTPIVPGARPKPR